MTQKNMDSSGNPYYECSNIRVTCLEKTHNGEPGIRIQAYKNGESKALHQGAELPLGNAAKKFEFLALICEALKLTEESI